MRNLICLAALLCAYASRSQIVINEFMAANSSAVLDPDNGETSDWIELYNTTSTDIDLTGYYLTDNLSDTLKWPIPAGTVLPASGFLVFWADGTDVGFHTSFSLSSIGEEIGIYDATLNLIDGFVFDAQETDISYGRETDGSTVWSWFSVPTAGSSNNSSTPYLGITHFQPHFSVVGGFFDQPQSLELTSLGGTIYYTLDGRTPTLSDSVYTQPITFDTSTFIRARVFEPNYVGGPVITHSYFFDPSFQDRGLLVVSLVTDPDYFWDPVIGIYVQDFKPEWEQPLNIELFENDGNNQSVFNLQAGVKINGLYSWQLPQKMLGIYFRKQYGASSLEYPIFADRDRSDFGEFILRASGSDWSYTLFRDGLCQSLTQENGPVHNQGFRPSIVFINGQYMGIHNMRSRSDGEDVEQTYGLNPGDYDIINNDGEIEEGDLTQFNYLDSLLNSDLTVTENYQLLNEVLDITNFTDFWITEIWSSNSSWGHNTRMWKPKGQGKWQCLFGDLDRGFVGSTDDPIGGVSIPLGNSDDYARNWFYHLFQNEEYATFFAQRFTDHLYTSFHPTRVGKIIDKFKGNIVNEIAYHVARWTGTTSSYGNGISTVEFWENEVLALYQFAEQRLTFMLNDLQNTFGEDAIVSLNTGSFPNEGGTILINDFHVPDSPWNGSYFTNMPFTFTAVPNPGYNFVGWSAIESTSVFGLGESWKYNDQGVDLGSSWTASNFDDSVWSAGNGELGYGEGDEATTVSYGPDAGNKFITTYFRKTFEYTGDVTSPVSCIFNIRRDDGVVVYLNGVEILRSNMPEGNINYLTGAATAISGANESALNEFLLDVMLVNGTNVLAIEVHQVDGASSDISFDASMSLIVPSQTILTTDAVLPVTLTEAAGFIARYVPTGACLLPDTINSDLTLSIDCSPYLANYDTYVLPDVTLTVDPGVEVWFSNDKRLIVQGDLQVNGTPTQGVLFKANTDYGATAWGNISFEHSTDTNHLHYMELKDATTGAHPIHNRAAISCYFSEIEMDHVTLMEVLDNPIFGEYSSFTLDNCIIQSDVTGDLINVKYGESHISNCTFIGNNQPDTDAIDYDRVVDGVVQNTTIEGLFGFNSDGVDLGEECQNVLVENCLINDCTDKGISIGQSSTATIRNTTIVNCNLGFGIKDLGEATIDHVTLYSNLYSLECYEKNVGLGGGFANITNSILSNSSGSPLSVDALSVINATNCIYDTDTMPGETNVWMDPQFVDAPNYDFHLLSESNAINAAIDGEDLGTLSHLYTAVPRVMISDIQYMHLINADQEFIKILNASNDAIDLSLFTVSNAIDFTFPEGIVIAPDEKIMLVKDITLFPNATGQIFQWTSGALNNAGEMILLADQHGVIVDHVEYDDVAPWPMVTVENEYMKLIAPTLDNHFASSWVSSEPIIHVVELNEQTFATYPNPAKNTLNIVSSELIRTVEVFDLAGKLMMQVNVNASASQLNIESLPSGIYTLRFNGNEAQKLIKE